MPASTTTNRQPSRRPARQPFTTPERAVAYKRVARLRLQRSGGSLGREIVHGVRASAGVLSRIRMIDEVRGLFLTWMICAHSMALIALPAGHPFQYLRPRGWSTIGFVMLTGLALAMLNLRRPSLPDGLDGALYRRSLQIAAIAVVSNMAFLLMRMIVDRSWSGQTTIDILTLRAPWSISAILLPTAALVAIGPWLLRLTKRVGAPAVALATLALTLLLDIAVMTASSPRIQSVLTFGTTDPGYFSFPIFSLLRLALWGFGFGALLATPRISKHIFYASAVGVVVVATQPWLSWSHSMVAESRLLVVLGAVSLAAFLPVLERPRAVLALLGRCGLLIFLVHRVVVQAGVHILGDTLTEGWLAASLIGSTMLVSLTLAYVRDTRPRVRRILKQCGM